MMWKEPKKKKTFESRNQDDSNKVRERALPFNHDNQGHEKRSITFSATASDRSAETEEANSV